MKRIIIALIKAYQTGISPYLRPCCRFTPSCSHYACAAVEKYGALRGAAMAVWRVLRCNPFGKGGYDPVP